MECNSIRNNLTRDDIISDIILSMGADIDASNVYVIVEGDTDVRFINQYLTDNVLIYESYDGKTGVEYIAGVHFSKNDRVIGIRDRDYQLCSSTKKIFFYDYNCMEMMLIANENVFYKLYAEYYSGNTKYKQLKRQILMQLMLLSIVRKNNEREMWGITLKGLSIASAWDDEKQELNEEIIINKINSMNNNFITKDRLCILKRELSSDWGEDDFYFYTQGHDFFKLFTIICNRPGRRGVKPDEVESSARCAFRMEDMIKTDMYREIVEYGKKINLTIVKNV